MPRSATTLVAACVPTTSPTSGPVKLTASATGARITFVPSSDLSHDGSMYAPLVYTPLVTVPALPLMSAVIAVEKVLCPPTT